MAAGRLAVSNSDRSEYALADPRNNKLRIVPLNAML